MAHDRQAQTTLNIPSIIVFSIFVFFLVRYFFFSPSASNAAHGAAGRRIPMDKIDTVAAMFPQLSRRDIEWDLVRNGGSAQATIEKVLRRGRLDNPPPNFRAQDSPTPVPAPSGASATRAPALQKTQYTDLVTRYNLTSRLTENTDADGQATSSGVAGVEGDGSAAQVKAQQQAKGWSTNKAERQELLKKRREEMVLAARRKMLEKDRASATASTATSGA